MPDGSPGSRYAQIEELALIQCGGRPNRRLKLTARVGGGMTTLSSARRSLSAIR